MPNLKDKFYEKKIFLVTSGILSIILLTAYIFMIANNNKEPIEPNRYGLDGDSHYYEKHPILRDLPIEYNKYDAQKKKTVSFRIDGGAFTDCKAEFCLKVTDYSGDSYDAAIEKLKEYGYDPSKYEIITVFPESHQKSE